MSDQFHPEHDDMPPEAGLASPRFDVPEPPHPVNWNLLTANDLEAELLELNRWVDWLRHTYGLSASVVPPYWHRHPELLWELSALHLHWLCAYDPEQNGSAPLGWPMPVPAFVIGCRPAVRGSTETARLARRAGPVKTPLSPSRTHRSRIATKTSFGS